MKHTGHILAALFGISMLLSGCTVNRAQPAIQIRANEQAALFTELDPALDTLRGRAQDQDVNFDTESAIFLPLLQRKEEKGTVPLLCDLEFRFAKAPSEAVLYDHLLSEEGHSYFQRSIREIPLRVVGKEATVELSAHPATGLFSDRRRLPETTVRGFRLVTKTDGKLQEYVFVLYVKRTL